LQKSENLRRGAFILLRKRDVRPILRRINHPGAALAQLVEHRIRNAGVACSSHASGTISSSAMAEVRIDGYRGRAAGQAHYEIIVRHLSEGGSVPKSVKHDFHSRKK
jgi:hypothetical protein